MTSIYFMDPKDKKEEERPAAYPKPSEADKQLKNQPEFIDEEPNKQEKETSDLASQQTKQEP